MKLSVLAEQNPWWKLGVEFARYDQQLKSLYPIDFTRKSIKMDTGDIYVIRGPRQAGKTTYMKKAILNLMNSGVNPTEILYLSADLLYGKQALGRAIDTFFGLRPEASKLFVFIDEITGYPNWQLELKKLYDLGRMQRSVVVASGSSASKLKRETELLPGRGLEGNTYFLKPLCFRMFATEIAEWLLKATRIPKEEILPKVTDNDPLEDPVRIPVISSDQEWEGYQKFTGILKSVDLNGLVFESILKAVRVLLPFERELNFLLNIYLQTGGFPGVINDYLDKRFLKQKEGISADLGERFMRFILGDLSSLGKTESSVRGVLSIFIDNYGQKFSFSKAAGKLEMGAKTMEEYLSVLEESFICFVHPCFDLSQKRIAPKKNKKVYFFDPFAYLAVKSWLTGADLWKQVQSAAMDEDIVSRMVEALVVSHLRLAYEIPYRREPWSFMGYYYDRHGREVDAVLKFDERLTGIEVKYGSQARKAFHPQGIQNLITLSADEVEFAGKRTVVPAKMLLALLAPSEANL